MEKVIDDLSCQFTKYTPNWLLRETFTSRKSHLSDFSLPVLNFWPKRGRFYNVLGRRCGERKVRTAMRLYVGTRHCSPDAVHQFHGGRERFTRAGTNQPSPRDAAAPFHFVPLRPARASCECFSACYRYLHKEGMMYVSRWVI